MMKLFYSSLCTLIFSLSFSLKTNIQNIKAEIIIYKQVDTINLKLHIYKPVNFDKSKTYNSIVFFHGQGWDKGNYKAFKRQSMYLASRVIIAISVEYRLKNFHGTIPFDAVEDAKSAIRYVRKHAKELNINPNKTASGGGSAGGHLAAVCGNVYGLEGKNEDVSISSKPNALVLFNPVYDNSKKGYGFRRMEGRYLEISPLHNITKNSPSTIFFGIKDKTTPVISSKEYERKMKDVSSRIDLHLYKDTPHSFFNKGNYFIDTLIKTDIFLESLGYLKGKPTLNN
jgi:acetyl esterase